ncbi:zinc finger protein 253-like [Protopterus annectens]|uniref:zinc finger protein 253-like n=1 Tax=Protopterus annectens TaxID=7888 RepID=UPI001CFADD28|nr:zinc finger protein 253-like [Protopterus annectens]
MKLEVPETFKDVAVEFSREEWQILSKEEKQLHQEVMVQNYDHMVSIGYEVPWEELGMLLDPDELTFSIMEENATSVQLDPCDVPQTIHRWAECEGHQRSLSEDHMNSECTKRVTDSMTVAGYEDVLHRNQQNKYMESDLSLSQNNELKGHLQRHEVKELCRYSNCKQRATFPFTCRTRVKTTQRNNGFNSSHCLNIFKKCRVSKSDNYKNIQVTHQQLFTGGKPYEYGSRAKSFIKKDKSIIIQTGEKPYKRAVCDKNFTQKINFTLHENIHKTGKLFKCIPCGKSFARKSSLTNHERMHRGDKPYKCTTCDKSYAWKCNLRKHEGIHSGGKLYKCTTCGKSFAWKQNIAVHMKTHVVDNPCKCSISGKSFHREHCTAFHKQLHTGDKLHKYDTCDKSFTGMSDLIIHKKIHGGNKSCNCIHCGKSFASRSSLTQHEKIHREVKPYKCTICGKGFAWSNTLKQHAQIHSGEKPYKCTTCGKSFARKHYIALHMKTHTLDKPYKCNTCGKSFTWKHCITIHKKTHTADKPYKCDTCGKSFTHRCNLKAHENVHIKSYFCTMCSKSLHGRTASQSMRKVTEERSHMNVHLVANVMHERTDLFSIREDTLQKAYKCSICSKDFTQKDNLLTHKKVQSEINPITVPHVE